MQPPRSEGSDSHDPTCLRPSHHAGCNTMPAIHSIELAHTACLRPDNAACAARLALLGCALFFPLRGAAINCVPTPQDGNGHDVADAPVGPSSRHELRSELFPEGRGRANDTHGCDGLAVYSSVVLHSVRSPNSTRGSFLLEGPAEPSGEPVVVANLVEAQPAEPSRSWPSCLVGQVAIGSIGEGPP